MLAIITHQVLCVRQVVWDSLQNGQRLLSPNLSNVRSIAPTAVRLWSTGYMGQNGTRHQTSKSSWKETSLANSFICSGYARYGVMAAHAFSAPMITDMNTTCASLAFRKYLWSDISLSTPSSCECRKMVTLSARLRDSCLITPDPSWPGPGLVKCDQKEAPPLASIKYHPTTGQIRISGKCLTAFPYSSTQLTNSSETYLPWGVSLSDCVNYQSLDSRQSWDLPDGVGTVLAALDWKSNDRLGIPSGRVGRIMLRGSSDIGHRCLDVAITPLSVPTKFPVAFLEASLCGDPRLVPGDFGMWSFYMNSTSTPNPPSSVASTDGSYPAWQACSDSTCSVCSKDDEYRATWQSLDPAVSGPRTDPVSLPSDFIWKSQCDADTLKEVAVPDALASLSSSCFCQEQPVLITFNRNLTQTPKLTSIIWSGQDDFPSPAPTPTNTTTNVTR